MPDNNIPDWVTETPDDVSYNLAMFGDEGAAVQDIPLTREEFIELKRRLAELRGYTAESHAIGFARKSTEDLHHDA